ncbi:MAG: CoA transferase [Desulfohalobiaceae bacterium]|nr:CoA transferase [Desulfohalobiaceae bacterium]
MSVSGALSGMKVVDLSRLFPGPYCSMILADHGARVIAVEDKRFREDLFLRDLFRNKEHVQLNLKTRQGREIFFSLVRDADVLLEGFRPGVVDKLGVDYATVSGLNPGIVYCSLSGYGQTGPYAGRAGHDANYLALSGLLDLVGPEKGPPCIPGFQAADIAGGLHAATGILMALWHRERTGEGQYLDISIADCAMSLAPALMHLYRNDPDSVQRGRSLFSHKFACYNIYATADERYIAVGALERPFWERLCRALGLPEYIPLQYDESRRVEIIQAVTDVFASRELSFWEQELSGLDACCEPVLTLSEALESTLFRERGMVRPTDGEATDTPGLGVPVGMSRTPGGVRREETEFGRDTESLLRELGYGEGDIGRLREEDVI